MEPLNQQNRHVHLISLGCARNRVDSEVMLGTLFGKGWKHIEDPSSADAIIINTCGFIQSAKEESIETILHSADYKKENPELKLVVTGCLTQRYKKQLAQGLPEVDLFVGTDEFTKLGELLDQPPAKGAVIAKRTHYLYHDSMPRINTLGHYSAYVKVAEGCQHQCSFCIIPAIRGKLRSRPIESITSEVKSLVADGVREVNLIAQDLAAYGREQGQDLLLPLLKSLVKIEGLKWLRLMYVYPENINEEFLDFFANEDKLVKYLDVPVQHASDAILRKMKRDVNQESLKAIFKKLRARIPEISIRTSVMVGFPSETEEDFKQLKDFVKEVKFEHLGCFKYSQEEGTVAGRMPEQIEDDVKEARLDEIMELQKGVSEEALKSCVGKKLPVLILGPSSESEFLWEGRLSTQAPEVDGIVYINDGPVKSGAIQMVEITESHTYDLVGRVLDDSE